MKCTLILTMIAATVGTGAALAQGMEGTIPFDFTVAKKLMPAGSYAVKRVEGASTTYTLQIRNVKTAEAVVIVSPVALDVNASANGNGKIVFRCSTGACALAEVHSPGERTGRALPVPKAPRGDSQRTVAIQLGHSEGKQGF